MKLTDEEKLNKIAHLITLSEYYHGVSNKLDEKIRNLVADYCGIKDRCVKMVVI